MSHNLYSFARKVIGVCKYWYHLAPHRGLGFSPTYSLRKIDHLNALGAFKCFVILFWTQRISKSYFSCVAQPKEILSFVKDRDAFRSAQTFWSVAAPVITAFDAIRNSCTGFNSPIWILNWAARHVSSSWWLATPDTNSHIHTARHIEMVACAPVPWDGQRREAQSTLLLEWLDRCLGLSCRTCDSLHVFR